jgi:uncharacterized protein
MAQKTFYTYYIIAACVAVFLIQTAVPQADQNWIVTTFAITPALVFSQPWTLVTAMFLHANFWHIFLNMFTLFIFGPYLENKIGGRRFLLVFLATGILGNIGYCLLEPNPFIAGLGASGAIYGVMGALAILEPNLPLYMFFLVPLPMWMFMFFWTLINLWGTLSLAGGIGYSAHLVGIVAGGAYAYTLKKETKSILEHYGLD